MKWMGVHISLQVFIIPPTLHLLDHTSLRLPLREVEQSERLLLGREKSTNSHAHGQSCLKRTVVPAKIIS